MMPSCCKAEPLRLVSNARQIRLAGVIASTIQELE
jgi:hypothetical protein